jgi:hypothetical protein
MDMAEPVGVGDTRRCSKRCLNTDWVRFAARAVRELMLAKPEAIVQRLAYS